MSGICFAAAMLAAVLPAQEFTLAWTHSIEKVRWEEDWRSEAGTLVLVEARIRGSGAGMEPPAGAVLKDGAWHYRPAVPPLDRLLLSHSPYAAGYQLCLTDACRPLADMLPGLADIAVIEITPCQP